MSHRWFAYTSFLLFISNIYLNKNFYFFFCFCCSSDIFLASFSLSTEWIKSNILTAYLTLFVCNLPIRCNFKFLLFVLTSLHFSSASWTLFSPKSKWPYSIKGEILSIPKVFDTAIIFGTLLILRVSKIKLIFFWISNKFWIVLCMIIY